MDEALLPACDALGEAAYRAALGRGAAMDDEVVGYALGEFRRVAAHLAEPGTQTPEALQACRGRAAGHNRVTQARRRVASRAGAGK